MSGGWLGLVHFHCPLSTAATCCPPLLPEGHDSVTPQATSAPYRPLPGLSSTQEAKELLGARTGLILEPLAISHPPSTRNFHEDPSPQKESLGVIVKFPPFDSCLYQRGKHGRVEDLPRDPQESRLQHKARPMKSKNRHQLSTPQSTCASFSPRFLLSLNPSLLGSPSLTLFASFPLSITGTETVPNNVLPLLLCTPGTVIVPVWVSLACLPKLSNCFSSEPEGDKGRLFVLFCTLTL